MTEDVEIYWTSVSYSSDEDGKDSKSFSKAWGGKGKVQTYEPYEQSQESAGESVLSQRYTIHIPVNVPVHVGYLIKVRGYPYKFRVAGVHKKTYQTAQRLLCDAITTDWYIQ